MSEVYLNQIETATPPHECHQSFLKLLPFVLPPNQYSKVEALLPQLGIEKRHSVLSHLFHSDEKQSSFYEFGNFPSTQKRMQIYQEEALPLSSLAIEPLLQKVDRSSITHLLVTSCTGFYAPGLDIDIIQKFHLRPNVERNLIGFMGCYAAITALRVAFHIVRSQPHAKVLMVNTELCSLHWRENVSLDQLVSFLLFADGSAASLISAEPQGLKLNQFYTHILADSLDQMRWTISDQGFYMKLDSGIPRALRQLLKEEGPAVFQGAPSSSFKLWGVHPGGRAILDGIAEELQLPEDALQHSREVLRHYGNMSSPTVMFVLKKILEDSQSSGKGISMAFGPGLTLESFTFEK